ncbi:MAG: ParB/RepB/Spo0J family partition protein [Acidobacteria bacterium]|nr:ParB/RepB/Spo0J family partition protein [Acidobacteriota bacterium]
MPSTQEVANNHEYRNIPIAVLVESPTNPRKRFDERTLAELAASFKTQGVLEPLLVRPLEPSKYEVVIGARRLKAARLAELESVPVRVKQMTDAEAIEAQVVENLQREDIHPLEESLGFRSLLELGDPTYTIASIAARAGKSEGYVQGRIKLADLIPPVAEAFLKDTITIGHALLIAKLPDSQQQEAFNAAFRSMWLEGGNQQVLIPVRELAVWIESNILLQLASASFDKQDEALVPAAGSCANCPKRTGFNKLLFADVRKDSCTDPQCFRSKIDAHVAKTLEGKPQLVQISSAWNTREGAPLGRNRYVELELKKAKTNGTRSRSAPYQKPCEKMTEAVVMDGGRRGELVKVCADLSCRVHHPDTPSPDQIAEERAEERKRIEKDKQAITTRHYVLAKVLERVSAPLKKADLLTLAQYTIANLSYNQAPALAKRHKVETAKTSKSPQEVLMKKVGTYDEAELSRLLLEIGLLDSAYQRGVVSEDLLMDAAKRYRVDVEKIEKAVAAEFAAKKDKKTKPKAKNKAKVVARA